MKSLAICLALAVGCTPANDPATGGGTPPAPDRAAPVGGIYYGMSETPAEGHLAWLVRLGSGGGGSLYLPPGTLAVTQDARGAGGDLSFRTEPGIGGAVYGFAGAAGEEGMTGTLRVVHPGRSHEPVALPLTLERVPDAAIGGAGVWGRYADVRFNEDTGDLDGMEVVLLPTRRGAAAAYTSFDDGHATYGARATVGEAGAVAFATVTPSGPLRCSGTLDGTVLALSCAYEGGAPAAVRLQRQQTLEELLGV
jgi:hypothetical protein